MWIQNARARLVSVSKESDPTGVCCVLGAGVHHTCRIDRATGMSGDVKLSSRLEGIIRSSIDIQLNRKNSSKS